MKKKILSQKNQIMIIQKMSRKNMMKEIGKRKKDTIQNIKINGKNQIILDKIIEIKKETISKEECLTNAISKKMR